MARFLYVVVTATSLIVGCAYPADDQPLEPSPIEALATRDVPRNPVADSRARGRQVYHHYCAICHGADGKGDGFNSSNLAVAPRDFTNPAFWQQATDKHLLLAVSKGGPAVGKSVLMPAWGRTLTDGQIRDVVAFLRTLAAPGERHGDSSAPPPEPQ
jgi:mono/diheme cytochrome c family protein